MGRDGWIWIVAFLAILGVGALLILPRLQAGRPSDAWPPPETGPGPADDAPPAAPAAEVTAFRTRPTYEPVDVVVSGPGGPLRGPLRPVHGARVEHLDAPDARIARLRVQPLEPVVSFGAAGHRWVRRAAGGLRPGERIELPVGAPALVVRVRERDGRPVPDLPLRVEPAAPGPPPRTDTGGTLVLDHLPEGLVEVGPAPGTRAGPRLRLWAGRDADVHLVLEPAWEVTGRLVAGGGAPPTHAIIEGWGPGGRAGRADPVAADGTFVWRGPALARLALSVRGIGCAEHVVEAVPPAVGPLRTDAGTVVLDTSPASVEGRVASAFLEPGAYVLLEPAVAAVLREVYGAGQVLGGSRRIDLGPEGTFAAHDLPAGLPMRIAVLGAGARVDAIVTPGVGEPVSVVLEPPAGEIVAGAVRGPDGRPASGLVLLVSRVARAGDRPQPGDLEVVTGADGRFRVQGLTGPLAYLRAYPEGGRSLFERAALPLEAPLDLRIEARVQGAERRVTGTVYDGIRGADAAGRPIYGPPLPGVMVRCAGVTAHTDAEGHFVLEGVEPLAPTASLAFGYEPGALEGIPAGSDLDPRAFLPDQVADVVPGGPPLDLVLPRAATLRFRALDALDDTPLAFVHVVVRTDQGDVLVDRGVAPDDGRVVLGGLPPRGVELSLAAPDRRFVRAPIPLVAGQVHDAGEVLLSHGMRVEGRVLSEEGAPVPDARVGAYGRGWQHGGQDPGAERALLFRTTTTDAGGRFVLEGFDPRKPADFAVWAPDLAPTTLRVALPPFSETVRAEVEVRLVPPAWLALDLHADVPGNTLGPRVHGALVDVEHAHDGSDWLDLVHRGLLGGPVASSRAWREASEHLLLEARGAEGYVVGPLRPAPYELWVERPGYETLSRRITVIDPDVTVLRNLGTGVERRFGTAVTRFVLEMAPAR